MANRIESALQAKNGGNQSELARFIGVSPQAVQKWIAGESEPRGKNLQMAAQFLGVSAAVLKFGPSALTASGEHITPELDLTNNDEYPAIRRVKIRLSAGISGFAIEHLDSEDAPIVFSKYWYVSRGYKPENLIAIRVNGASMEPGMSEGDTVVVNTIDKTPKDGEVFAINYEGESIVKRLSRDAGEWWLTSDNPDQRRYPRKLCEGDMCLILGRIVHKQSERI